MPKTITREPFVRQSISFPRSLLVEIRRIVIEDEQHGNLSRYMQDLARADVSRRQPTPPASHCPQCGRNTEMYITESDGLCQVCAA
jgi:hypothetical protein